MWARSHVGARRRIGRGIHAAQGDQHGDRYILDGRKVITNGPEADVWWCTPKTIPESRRARHQRVHHRKDSRFHAGAELDKLGCAAPAPVNWCFDSCEVPAAKPRGRGKSGCQRLMRGLDYSGVVLVRRSARIMAPPWTWPCRMCANGGSSARPSHLRTSCRASSPTCRLLNACRSYVYMVASACDRADSTRKMPRCILFCRRIGHSGGARCDPAPRRQRLHQDYPCGRLLRDAKLYEIAANV